MHSLLLYIILDGNGSIKIKEIIRHILQIINHPRLSLLLIKDYTSLLHHDILTRNHYIVDIPSSQWKGMIRITGFRR